MPVEVLTTACGCALIALGCWATFTTAKTARSVAGGRADLRGLVAVGVAFVASCLVPGVALVAGAFRRWMLIPLGFGYLLLLPFPCVFPWANHGWVRTARTILFALVGAGLVIIGAGWPAF